MFKIIGVFGRLTLVITAKWRHRLLGPSYPLKSKPIKIDPEFVILRKVCFGDELNRESQSYKPIQE